MERILWTGIALICMGLASVGKADDILFQQGQERIVHDARTGEYIIDYIGNDGTLKSVRWTPASNVSVSVRSKFNPNNDRIAYRYAIKNHKDSAQPVLAFRILVRNNAKAENLSAPKNWDGDLIENYDDPSLGVWTDWTVKRTEFSLSPGETLTGLQMTANDLPGIGMARVRGLMSVLTYPDEGPSGAMIEFMEQGGFLRKASQGVLVPVAAPKIPVGQPFDPILTLTGIQKHLNQDLVSMKLIDPVFAAQLDRTLQAAIDAAKLNNTKALKDHLKDLRRALKKEHDDVDKEDDDEEDQDGKPKKSGSIDKLAARVLDFDIKYVEKRLDGKAGG